MTVPTTATAPTSTSLSPGVWRFSEARLVPDTLAMAWRDAGLSPRTVSVDRPSMDSVFMALTGQPPQHDDATSPDAAAPSTPSTASPSARPSDSQEQS